MPTEMTSTGLPGIGSVPWGSHFCQFYSTPQELAGALVPFFKAGLDNNEQCIWVTSEPLRADAAREALRSVMPDLDQRLRSRQIEIVDFDHWYTKAGAEQDIDGLLNDWIARKEQALALGYTGLRVSGNTCWIETRQQWRTFAEYEARVNACFRDHRIVAMCSYHLGRCSGADTIDAIRNHQFAITCDSGAWDIVESAQLKTAREELWQTNRTLERRVTDRTAELRDSERRLRDLLDSLPAAVYTTDAAGRITYYNQPAVDLAGRTPTLGSDDWCVTWRLYTPDGRPMPHDQCPMAVALKEDRIVRGEEAIAERPDGTRVPFIPFPTPLHDSAGNVTGAVNMLVDITERKRAERDVQLMLQISQRLSSTLEIDALLDALVNEALHLIGAEGGCAGLRTPDGMVCHKYFKGKDILPLTYCWPPGIGLPGWLIEHKTPYLTNNASTDSQIVQELCQQFGVRSAISTPILNARNQVIGFFEIHNKQDGTGFTKHDQDKLLTVSHIASVAIQNAKAYEAIKASEQTLRRNEAWLAGQKEAFQAAMNGAPLETSLGILIRTAVEQAETPRRCAFYIANAEGTGLHHVVGMPGSYAQSVDGFRIAPESLSCGLAVATGQPVITPDVETEPRWQPWLWLARQHDFRACWSFPVETATGSVVGSFAMYFQQPHSATQRDQELAAALTQTAAIIISRHQETQERARISRELVQSQHDLAAELAAAQHLQRISTELIADQDAQALYEKVLDAALAIMRSDFASLQMFHPERGEAGELRLLGFRGFDPEAARFWEWVRADSGSTCGQVLRTGRRVIASNVETCDFMAGTDDRRTYLQTGIRAVQSTPLFSRSGRLLGMISTHWRKPCHPSDSDLRRFDVLARQAADLIERAKAEAALRDSEEGLLRLNQNLETRVHEEIAAREEAQAQLAHAQRMEALGQLAGGIAHDFNNVIQAVQGGASLIERRSADAERVRGLARRIMEASERGGAITRRLLAFARRGDLRAEPTNIVSLLADMQEILSHTLGAGITVRVHTEPDLPPVLVDKAQLETVLVNLSANARDAMQRTGTLTFAASTEIIRNSDHRATLKPGAYIRLAVSDTGCGMTPEVLAHASEPFFTTKGIGQGTGLGLAMAHGFARQSGGGLAIESAVGRGTIIQLWFPVAEEAAHETVSVENETALAIFGDARGRLLLVDDNEFVRETLAQEMEAEGYAVLPAASGAEALTLLDAGEPVDLIISDLSMHGMDGVSVIRAAQRRRPRLPAILLTGFTTTAGTALEAAVSGSLTLLRKPVQGRQLAERVAMLLERAAVGG